MTSARVASIVGALSERDAGPPATRRSCLRPTLTKGIAGAANYPATRGRFFFGIASAPPAISVQRGVNPTSVLPAAK